MSVVLHVKSYCFTADDVLNAQVPELGKTLKELISGEWKSTLKSMRDIILGMIKHAIPDQQTYVSIMLHRALPNLERYVNVASLVGRKALIKFRAKQARPKTFQRFIANVETAYAEGGRFEKRVDEASDDFIENVIPVLRIVGARGLGIGVAPKVFMWLTGDMKVLDMRTPYDAVWEGVPTYVFDPNLLDYMLQPLIPSIVDGLYYAILFHEAGMAKDRDAYLLEVSVKIKNFIDKLIASQYKCELFVLGYDSEKDNFYVEVKIVPAGSTS